MTTQQKRQLKSVIREELENILSESNNVSPEVYKFLDARTLREIANKIQSNITNTIGNIVIDGQYDPAIEQRGRNLYIIQKVDLKYTIQETGVVFNETITLEGKIEKYKFDSFTIE